MKRIFFIVYCSLLLAALPAGRGAAADLDWQEETHIDQCPDGPVVIDITHKVVNDVDSAVGGGAWATDNYRRRLRVVQVGPDTFCAVTRYNGSFVTDDGPSPQGTDPDGIAAGIKGSMKGGYRTTIFTGTLNPSPPRPTTGNIGKLDYGCNVETDPGDHSTCTTLFSWTSTYFLSVSGFDLEWWGWIYRSKRNGAWINACAGPDPDCPGNSGDITD